MERNEEIDVFTLIKGANACGEVKMQEEKKKKRFWLRMELYKMYYAWHRDEMEEAFQWIYDAPIGNWGNMLECLRQAMLINDDVLKGTPLERGKQLFSFLS